MLEFLERFAIHTSACPFLPIINLINEFPRHRYDDALELLDSMIEDDETNPSPRKRKIAILKAKRRIPEAIKELNEYLKK